EILELLVENKNVPVKLIKKALRDAVINDRFVPVVCGAAFKNKGVQFLLDAVCAYLPSPADVPDTKVYNMETKEYSTIKNSADGDFMALIFKIVTDQFLGKLAFLRVYSGAFDSGKRLYNTTKDRVEKIDRIFSMHAEKKEIIKRITAGDIVAVAGLKNTRTGQTLSSKNTNLVFEPPVFPEPVISQAIEPAKPAQLEALSIALSKLVDEDPTFIVRKDETSSETIVSGMGELHLEVNIERIKREFNVPIKVSTPKVNYKEGITSEVTEVGKYVKQTGGHGQYAHVVLKLSPNSEEKFEFKNAIKGGSIPSNFIPSVETGVKMGIESGPLAGYPVRNLTVELLDGSFHEVDSSDLAFKIGSFETMKKALKKASPILLEPIMEIEIRTPTQYLGDVLGDLSSRRGNTAGLTTAGNLTIIRAFVPLAEMFGYATVIRSLTQGRAGYVMSPKGYERVPQQVADDIIGKE
ncbi:MAG: elongation factor G, partial [Elusimicrobia bacterium]|nr:elongation factor G [Elusimicrobiota bacterium]